MMQGLVKEIEDVLILVAALPKDRQRNLARTLVRMVEAVENLDAMRPEEIRQLRTLRIDAQKRRLAALINRINGK